MLALFSEFAAGVARFWIKPIPVNQALFLTYGLSHRIRFTAYQTATGISAFIFLMMRPVLSVVSHRQIFMLRTLLLSADRTFRSAYFYVMARVNPLIASLPHHTFCAIHLLKTKTNKNGACPPEVRRLQRAYSGILALNKLPDRLIRPRCIRRFSHFHSSIPNLPVMDSVKNRI